MYQQHPTRRSVLASGLAVAATLPLPALARSPSPVERIGGVAFGAGWTVALPQEPGAQGLSEEIGALLGRIDALMSPWRGDTAIGAFNARATTEWVPADREFVEVVRVALQVSEASAGAFDPSVGPLVGRWGFGPIKSDLPPGPASFEVADDAIRKSHPVLTLDLCGIAKGYALDCIMRLLLQRGHMNFVVDIGGEVAAWGDHPAGRKWRIAVEDPRPDHAGVAEVASLRGLAIATSGNRANGYTLGKRRYSHIIDPVSAAPVISASASVSVIGESAMAADAWATALMAAGDGGPALAERNGLDALFLVPDGALLKRIAVGRFDDHVA